MGQADERVLDKTQLRDASTVILLRQTRTGPHILLGQRGVSAAFMPSKFVFPGGAVDAADHAVPLAGPPEPSCAEALSKNSTCAAPALLAAAARELWEETGLLLGAPGPAPQSPPEGWGGYLRSGLLPDPGRMRFVFRAITPPGRPRRFDARFFLVNAEDLASDPDDFSRAEDELSHLQWVALKDARSFDLPFITEVVLAEVTAIQEGRAHPGVPFFDNTTDHSRFARL